MTAFEDRKGVVPLGEVWHALRRFLTKIVTVQPR